MQKFLKFIVLAGDLFGAILFIIIYFSLKKMLKESGKQNKDDFLSDNESKRFHQYILYILIGVSISVITSLINLILLFLKKPF